jgi:ubiquinone/menaquinone biosynthesis C-methylase UbiE
LVQFRLLEKEYHDRIAKKYDALCKINSLHARLFNSRRVVELIRVINQNSADYVLELGCGTGQTLKPLSQKTYACLIGIDISREMLKKAKEKGISPNEHLLVADSSNLPLKKGFGLVYCIETLHHMPNIYQVFDELLQVLKNDGNFYIEEPHFTILSIASQKLGISVSSERSPCEKSIPLSLLLGALSKNYLVETIIFRGYIALLVAPRLKNPVIVKLAMTIDDCFSRIPLIKKLSLRIVILGIKKQNESRSAHP